MNNFNLGYQKSKPHKRNFLSGVILVLLWASTSSYAIDPTPGQDPGPGTESDPRLASAVDTYVPSQDKAQIQANKCKKARDWVQNIQTSQFGLSTDGSPSETYLDLLKKRDKLMGKRAVIKALLNIWDKYNNYLDANDKYNITPEEVKKSMKGLNDLKALLNNENADNIRRYRLMSDVFKGIDIKGLTGKNKRERFQEMKTQLQASCNKSENATLLYCEIAKQAKDRGENIWDSFKPGHPPRGSLHSPQAMLHKFLDASSDAFGDEWFGWFKNLSTMFVDNQSLKYDIVADKTMSSTVVAALDDAIKVCRGQLLDLKTSADCMKQDISKYVPPASAQKIKAYFAKQNMNAQDIVDEYLANSAHVAQAHEEATGGLIEKFNTLAQERAAIALDENKANSNMRGNIREAQHNFYRQSMVDVNQLSRQLNILKRNDDLYFSYRDPNNPNVNRGFKALNPVAQKANEQLKEALEFGTGHKVDTTNLFEAIALPNGEQKLRINKRKFFKFLSQNKISKEKLTQLLEKVPGSEGDSVNEKLKIIDDQITELRKKPQYKILEQFKRFTWDQLVQECSSNSDASKRPVVIDNSSCVSKDFSEVDKLIKFGEDYLIYQDSHNRDLNFNSLGDNCNTIKQEHPEIYKKNSYDVLCKAVFVKQKEIAARQQYFSRERVKARASVNTIWEDGKKVSQYRSKSWLELMPGALQMAMPSGIDLGNTWVRTQGVKNQMFGLTTYMKNRYNFMQMQYNQGVQMCNQTLSCYYSSQYQAFLPSYGATGVTNYGTNAFTSNSTFFTP